MLAFLRTTLKNYALRHFSNQEKTIDLLVSMETRQWAFCPHCGTAITPPPPKPEETFDRSSAASYLHIKEKEVYRLRIAGKLAYYQAENKKIRYRRTDLDTCFEVIWGFKRPE